MDPDPHDDCHHLLLCLLWSHVLCLLQSETGFSLMNLVMGIMMVVIGYQNLPAETTGTLVEGEGEEDAG